MVLKKIKDILIKLLLGSKLVPRGLFESRQYFRFNGPINFKFEKKDGKIIAISQNFRHGVIITSGKNSEELDRKIKDAILTSFEIPSSYAKEASIKKVGQKREEYAVA